MLADLVAYLEADATLAALLGAAGSNTKLYPLFLPHGDTTPAVLYSLQSDGGGAGDLLDECQANLRVVAEEHATAVAIEERLTELLDKQDYISISSSDKRVFYCKKIGGSDSYEEDTRRFVLTRLFHLKSKRNTGG